MHTIFQTLCILCITFYKFCLSPFLPKSCRFFPTCSEYALQAITLHGVYKGLWLTFKRIVRCNPWNAGGYDPVPPVTLSYPQMKEPRETHGK